MLGRPAFSLPIEALSPSLSPSNFPLEGHLTRNDKRMKIILTELLRAPPKLQDPSLHLKDTIWPRRSGVSGGRAAPLQHPSKPRYRCHTPGWHARDGPCTAGVQSSATWTVPISPFETWRSSRRDPLFSYIILTDNFWAGPKRGAANFLL